MGLDRWYQLYHHKRMRNTRPISLQPSAVDLRYFKLRILVDQIIKDIGIRKFDIMARTLLF